jgi:hypothetical protein
VLKQLKHIYNLVFLKYKLLFTYLKVLSEVPTSITRILIFLTIERSIKRRFRRSRDFFKLKSNLEKV